MKKFALLLLAFTKSLSADFTIDLKNEIQNCETNWIFSPFSIRTCLSMAAMGAANETEDEMRAALDLSLEISPEFETLIANLIHKPTDDRDFHIEIAQGLWVERNFPLLNSYADALEDSYKAMVGRIDFTPYTVDEINGWVEKRTEEKISHLIPNSAISPDTRLILANALYFHGKWQSPFLERFTQNEIFYAKNKEAIDARMMHQKKSLSYFENDSFQSVTLPFYRSSESLSKPICLLVLPKNGENFDLKDLESILEKSTFENVDLKVPKFEVESDLLLNDPLKSMGLERAFSKRANFSKISKNEDLYISSVYHKAFFSFDENGVEAASATAAIMNLTVTNLDPNPKVWIPFHANRPFYFLLVDQMTKCVLFIGQIQTL